MSEERFDKPRNIPANAQAIHGKAIAFPIKVCRDDEDDPSIEWYEDANGERVDPYTVMLALNAAYGTPSRVTNKRNSIAELRHAFEDLLENAPLDFIGTGSQASGRAEEKEWEARVLRLRVAIEQIANEPQGTLSSTAGVPDGWKLVPIEATPDMLAAARRPYVDDDSEDENFRRNTEITYAAMLDAAPAAPVALSARTGGKSDG